MYYRGDLSVLADYCRGEPVTICTEGGGNRTAAIVGFLQALARTKKYAKAYVAVSGSAGPVAAHMAGQGDGTFEVYKKLVRDHYIEWKWMWISPYGWVYAPTFNQQMLIREIERVLDVPAMQANPAQYGVAVLRYEDGVGEILEGKEDHLVKIEATTSIPGMCTPVTINGVSYVDGIGILVKPAVRRYWARKVIVLRARRRWWLEEFMHPYLARLNVAGLPRPLVNAIASCDSTFESEMERLRKCTRIQHIEVGPNEDDPFFWQWTDDIGLMETMKDNAREYLLRRIDEALLMKV